jgi:putative transposase
MRKAIVTFLAFMLEGQESPMAGKRSSKILYTRSAHEVLLGVFDGLPGLEEAFKAVYPKADVQRCCDP